MRTIVCFGEDWGGHPSTLQFLAKQLAKRYQLLWVDSLGLRSPRLSWMDLKRVGRKVKSWWTSRARRQSNGNVTVVSPLVLPFHGNGLARFINQRIVATEIQTRLGASHNTVAPIVITAHPSTEYLMSVFGECRRIYYCADEYTSVPGVDKNLVRQLEERLLASVDAVVVTSKALLESKAAYGKPVSLLRHGVDFEHFSAPEPSRVPEGKFMYSLARPIFGYHGLLQSIIDFDLIGAVARQRPTWSFVFIGNRFGDPGQLPSERNIHFIPAQPYEIVPTFVHAFDVCMIPYRLDQRTRNSNPVKLREYLAAGKPVLSTRLPEVEAYADVVAFADTPREFLERAEELLADGDTRAAERRRDRVRGESWHSVADEFCRILEDCGNSRTEQG